MDTQDIGVVASDMKLVIPAICFDFLSTRIFMISNCYIGSEGESTWQELPFFYAHRFSI
jgi:hypothetical protein